MSPKLPPADQLLASAAYYLTQGQQHEAAQLLLLCQCEIHQGQWHDSVELWLMGPRAVRDILADEDHEITPAVVQAFNAVLPGRRYISELLPSVQLVDVENADWRTELMELAHGRNIHNQGVDIPGGKIVLWKNLRFRSETERRIAAALDVTGVLFLPNCLARLNIGTERGTRESDFLVCRDGKWGILEVDGPYHNARAALDHERDDLFHNYGIRVIRRYTAEECYNDAPGVVRRFLTLLERNG